MEGSLSTFIYIAVAILVTLGIASMTFVAVSLVGDILGVISSQETTIKERFDEVTEIYDGRVLKGIDLLNTLKEFRTIDMTYPVIVTFTDHKKFKEQGTKVYLYSEDDGDGITNDSIKLVISVISNSMEVNAENSIVNKGEHKWLENDEYDWNDPQKNWPLVFYYEDRYNVTVTLKDNCHINGNVMQAIVIHFEKIVSEVGG